MVEALFVVCSLLAAALGLLGGWCFVLRRDRAASEQKVAELTREFGEVAHKAERLRAVTAEAHRLESIVHQLGARQAAAEREFAGYASDVAARREGAERELAAHVATLAARRSEAERELLAHAAGLLRQRASAEAEFADVQRRFVAQSAKTQDELNGRIAELRRSVEALEEREGIQLAGFYRTRYDFGTASEYQERLEAVREKQRAMIKGNEAAVCHQSWTVGGSRKAGEKMTRDAIKLMLRAFNGVCDAAVMKVRFDNAATLERRIRTDFEAINKLGGVNACEIVEPYLALKLEELALVHEHQEKKQAELEEQRAIREQMRDEERAQRELEKAQEDAEKEERRYRQALERARAEAEHAAGKAREALEEKIALLSGKLAEAQAQKQRAISRAQLTTAGHVYVISNVGSFGEHVYKIGMTRRLEPLERVHELGDASVPFPFDVHAMIYTENAPELERRLHKAFHERRVNRVNERKEFFRVPLDEIEQSVSAIGPELPAAGGAGARFVKTAVAEQYRKSVAMSGPAEQRRRSSRPQPPEESAAVALTVN